MDVRYSSEFIRNCEHYTDFVLLLFIIIIVGIIIIIDYFHRRFIQMANSSNNNSFSEEEDETMKYDPMKDVRSGTVREVGDQAIWSLSSCKPGKYYKLKIFLRNLYT